MFDMPVSSAPWMAMALSDMMMPRSMLADFPPIYEVMTCAFSPSAATLTGSVDTLSVV